MCAGGACEGVGDVGWSPWKPSNLSPLPAPGSTSPRGPTHAQCVAIRTEHTHDRVGLTSGPRTGLGHSRYRSGRRAEYKAQTEDKTTQSPKCVKLFYNSFDFCFLWYIVCFCYWATQSTLIKLLFNTTTFCSLNNFMVKCLFSFMYQYMNIQEGFSFFPVQTHIFVLDYNSFTSDFAIFIKFLTMFSTKTGLL